MKQKKIISTLIIGIMLISVAGAIVPTISADQITAVKGLLYVDDVIAGPGYEIQIIFPDETFSDFSFTYNEGFNYNVGIEGHEGETGDILVDGQIPEDNTTVDIPTGDDTGIYMDLHITGTDNQKPVAKANGPYTEAVGNPISFTSAGSYDPDGTIEFYEWDFESDGTYDWSSPTTGDTAHTYGVAGDYTATLRVTDNGGKKDTDTADVTILESDDEPPSKVEGLTVTDAKDEKLDLSWDAATDNVGVDHYEIYRDGSFLINVTGTSHQDTGLTNDQSYTYKVRAVDAAGNKGNFSDPPVSGTPTASPPDDPPYDPPDDPPGGGGGNQLPIADAGGPYEGFINEPIEFDGSGSTDDGEVVEYRWDFNGNGTYDTDWLNTSTTTHTYTTAGTYTVILQVKDNEGAIDDNETTATILVPNLPPTAPEVTGETTGMVDTEYTFTAVSTDADNDTISYIFDWGDNTTTTTDFLANGTATEQTHTWIAAGTYTISVYAYDNETPSETTEFTVIIEEEAEEEEEEPEPTEEKTDYTALLILLIIIIIIIIGGYAYYLTKKGEAKKQEQAKKASQKKKSSKKSGKK